MGELLLPCGARNRSLRETKVQKFKKNGRNKTRQTDFCRSTDRATNSSTPISPDIVGLILPKTKPQLPTSPDPRRLDAGRSFLTGLLLSFEDRVEDLRRPPNKREMRPDREPRVIVDPVLEATDSRPPSPLLSLASIRSLRLLTSPSEEEV